MSKERVPHVGALAALLLVFTACTAALLAHIGIDLAGDVVLVHDAYDGLDHRSRSDVFALGMMIALGALLRGVWCALRDARLGHAPSDADFDLVFGRGPWRFVGLVIGLTLPALAAMEAFDVSCSGGAIDDAADLFGGSFALGLAITIPLAAACALAVRRLLRIVNASRRTLTSALVRLIALITRSGRSAAHDDLRRGSGVVRRYRSPLAHRCAKRGPPLLAS